MVELSIVHCCASISAPVPKIRSPEVRNYARYGIGKTAFKHLLLVIAKMVDTLGWSWWEVYLPCLRHSKVFKFIEKDELVCVYWLQQDLVAMKNVRSFSRSCESSVYVTHDGQQCNFAVFFWASETDYRLQTWPEGRDCTMDIYDANSQISLKCPPCDCFRP